jgi:serine/threonine protein kinase
VEEWINKGELLECDSDSSDDLELGPVFSSESTCASSTDVESSHYPNLNLKLHFQECAISLDNIQVDHRIGQGRTSVVWKGYLKDNPNMKDNPPSDVAIKRISSLCDEQKVSQFLDDTAALRCKPHPNIQQILDVTIREQAILIVSEYCGGGSCYDLLHGCMPLMVMQAAKICVDVAEAMSYLHALQPELLHGNLTSRNVLLARAISCTTAIPHAKVCDFNLSRIVADGDMELTVEAPSIWMAPEVLHGGLYSDKADVYSFAILVCELFNCTAPFKKVDATDHPSLITTVRSKLHHENVHASWMQVIHDACAPEPSLRPSFSAIVSTLLQVPMFARNTES